MADGSEKGSAAPGAIRVRVLRGAAGHGDLVDWGPIPGSASRTGGILLYRGEEKHPEAGLWECTPGEWDCHVERDEFCHFLTGGCVYTHESGERTEIRAGDAAFFPAGWNGRCKVIETLRKVYLIC